MTIINFYARKQDTFPSDFNDNVGCTNRRIWSQKMSQLWLVPILWSMPLMLQEEVLRQHEKSCQARGEGSGTKVKAK